MINIPLHTFSYFLSVFRSQHICASIRNNKDNVKGKHRKPLELLPYHSVINQSDNHYIKNSYNYYSTNFLNKNFSY